MVLCLREDNERAKSLWVRIKEQTSKGDTAVGVCYRTPDQEEQVDEVFHRQLEGASQSQSPWFLWWTSGNPISAAGTTQLSTHSAGSSSRALITF